MAASTECQASLSLENVSVSFPIYHGTSRSLKKSLMHRSSGGRIARDANQRVVVQALNDVTIAAEKGDRLALIGGNGAGKTTLLRVMAGVYEPSSGVMRRRGRIAAMLDIGIGIDPELNGIENIRLRGLLLQLPSSEIEQKLDEIASFTELGEYLEMPVRTYSSGMMMRLTFAVSTCFVPEIILMDEWILSADAHFLSKAEKRISEFIENASIFVLASHNMEILRRWCTKAAWLESGRVRSIGQVAEIIEAYQAA
jgi:ABC-2 type transport system ATP-binding protein/lipopolysaccharide transport system ATP-binding protein